MKLEVALDENVSNVEMAVTREQKTLNLITRTIMTVADMHRMGLSESLPQLKNLCCTAVSCNATHPSMPLDLKRSITIASH